MSQIAQRLKNWRQKRGFTAKYVADQIGVSPSTYREWEYGRAIKGEPYAKLAEVFEVSLTELVTGERRSNQQLLDDLGHIENHVKNLRKNLLSLL